MNESDDSRDPITEDAAIEGAVISRLIHIYPGQATYAELQRELCGPAPSFSQRDAIERAVRELTGAGLLHRHGEFLVPTRTALHFNDLLGC